MQPDTVLLEIEPHFFGEKTSTVSHIPTEGMSVKNTTTVNIQITGEVLTPSCSQHFQLFRSPTSVFTLHRPLSGYSERAATTLDRDAAGVLFDFASGCLLCPRWAVGRRSEEKQPFSVQWELAQHICQILKKNMTYFDERPKWMMEFHLVFLCALICQFDDSDCLISV